MRISDWSSDVCSSDLFAKGAVLLQYGGAHRHHTVAVYDVHASVPLCRREFAQFSKAIAQGALRNAQLPRGAGAMHVHLIQNRADAIQLRRDRTSDVSGTSVTLRVHLGGRRTF